LNQLSDKEIIEKVLKGNHELYGVIIEKYERPVAAAIKGLLGDCPEAEEVGQDTFIRCFQSLSKFRGEAALKTYLIRIALNLSLNELKIGRAHV
jgi:RNA polymerase sigma-70 factor, ECF subfamily